MKLTPNTFSIVTAILVAAVLATVGFGVPPRVAPAAAAPTPPQVDVIEREDWGAKGGQGARIGEVDEVVIHHFWRPSQPEVVPAAQEVELLRGVESTHVDENGWSGVAYNFIVFQSGRVYEGRGWGHEGAHTTKKNDHTVGIAFAIDADEHPPTPEAWAAAQKLIEDGVAAGHIDADPAITGHNAYAEKSCPGRYIEPRLQELHPGDDA